MSNFYKIFFGAACLLAALMLNAAGEGTEFTVGSFTYRALGAGEVAVTGFADPQISLTDIAIPDSIEYGGAFYSVTAIDGTIVQPSAASLTLPASITSCSDAAFGTGSTVIPRVYIASAEQWLAIDLGANPNPFTIAKALYVNNERTTTLTIPDGTATIAAGRFKGLACVESVKLPQGCDVIEAGAFEGATIKNIELGSSLQSIGAASFKGAALVHLTIPASVLTIGDNAFEGCARLRTVKNGGSLVAIPAGAFRGCTSLYSLELGPNLAEIRTEAFKGCSNLTSVTVPNKVTTIAAAAFADAAKLRRIVLGTAVETIADDAFDGCTPAEIIVKTPGLLTIGAPLFSGATIFVADELVADYEADNLWADGNEVKPLAPLSFSLSTGGEPITEVVSAHSGIQVKLDARMSGQEFEGSWADSQPIVSWSSSDESVATVDPTGAVTPKAPGTATISAATTFDFDPYSSSCEIAVDYAAPTGVKISAQNTLMALGTNLALKAAVQPAGALQQVVWSVDPASAPVASISADGVITPIKPGKATFIAAAAADESVTASIDIDVVYAKPSEVVVTIDKEVLRVGDSAQLTATVNSHPHASQDVMWFTGDDKIATISKTGHLECVGVGNVKISALTMDNVHILGTIDLFVDYSEPTRISVTNPALALKIGDTEQIIFTVSPAGAEQRADWVSDNEEVATVDAFGNVTAVGIGSATITGTAGSITTTCSVAVDYADPVSVYVNYRGIYVTENDSTQLSAVVLPAGARQDLIWTTSNDSIATVDQNGMVHGLVKGNAAIIATSAANNKIWGGCNVIVMEPQVDAIESVEAGNSVHTAAEAGSIIVSGLEPRTPVAVYDINGRLLWSASAPASGRVESPALRPGVYIIRHGATSSKIAL